MITNRAIFAIARNVVLRQVEDNLVLIPLFKENCLDAELFTVSRTGKLILDNLDGARSLENIVEKLALQFDAPPGVIEQDVMQLIQDLLARNLITEVSRG